MLCSISLCISHLSVIPQVPNSSSSYRAHCRCRVMSMSSCSLSMKMCCMQPWKRFSLVSHLNAVLLVFGQPKRKTKLEWLEECTFGRPVSFYSCLISNHTSKKVAVTCSNGKWICDLQRGAFLLINGEGQQVVSSCQIHWMPVTIIEPVTYKSRQSLQWCMCIRNATYTLNRHFILHTC